jgi:N-acetylneuraminic acid mutarotase
MNKKLLFIHAIITIQIFCFTLTGQTWEKCAPLPEKMVPATLTVNGKIYAVRLADFYRGNLTEPSYMYEYDPTTDTWTKGGKMNLIRTYFGLTKLDNRIYAIGGVLKDGTSSSAIEEYEIKTGNWKLLKEMPLPLRGSGIVPYNGKIYIIGGSIRKIINNVPRDSSCTVVFEYSPQSDSWTIKSGMSKPRTWLAALDYKNKIYAIGGNNSNLHLGENTIEEYNPKKDSWKTICEFIIPIDGQCQSLVINNKIYTFSSDLDSNMKFTKAIIGEFNPSKGKWLERTSILSPIMDFNSLVYNKKLYLIGGHSIVGGNSNKIVVFDPALNTQVYLADVTQWMNGNAEIDGFLYLIGGVNVKAAFVDRVSKYRLNNK